MRLVPVGAAGLGLFTVGVYGLGQVAGLTPGAELGLAEFAASSGNWWVFIDLMLIAVSGGLYVVPLVTLIQRRARPDKRARVIAANNVLSAAFMVVSALITLWLLSLGRSVGEILLITGIASLVFTGALFLVVPVFVSGRVPAPQPNGKSV